MLKTTSPRDTAEDSRWEILGNKAIRMKLSTSEVGGSEM